VLQGLKQRLLAPELVGEYRRKVEELGVALRNPAIHDEALEIVRGLVDRLVVHFNKDEAGMEIELIGDIARMVELGSSKGNKKAALDDRAACSVKVVAGTCNHRASLVRIAI
jgi:hypothetical protein